MESNNITMELPASRFQSVLEQAPLLSTFMRPSSILLGVFILFFTASGLRKFLFSSGKKGSPSELIGRPGDRDFHNALLEGYKKVC